MEVTISSCSGDAARAAETLLGHNLEMASDTPFGIQSDRIRNATLSGFADQQTGIAPEWLPYPNHNFSGIRYELTPGMYLSGKSAQLIHNFCHRNDKGKGIVQKGIHLIGGERVVVTLWARAQHEPVSMSIGLRPMAKGHPYYDSASITIAATYWKEYTVTLSTPLTDDNALLTCTLDGSGMVWIDQIHLAAEGAGVVSPEMEKKIASLHVPVLRFPGGCISTTYHWRLGTGPQYLRPIELDPVFKMSVSYIFGTDEYLEFCTRNGITPQITINIGTGTVQEAEDWASYCAAWFKQRNLDLPLMYWQIGNEHYGSWELGIVIREWCR
ncbi:MAG TPA: hypothetical protein VHV83_16780 [Armatimonadota bacterium]|nr:hypothetical protein [Armatimonadota bacterium]